jgi:hypothetical protein
MALRNSDMIKTFKGAGTASLTAKVGTSLLIKDVIIYSAEDKYFTFKIDKTTVGYFRCSNLYGNHLAPVTNTSQGRKGTILKYLWDKGIFKGYPIAEGQTFYVEGSTNANNKIVILYDEYDAGDQRPDAENGSEATKYFIINYGDTGANIDSAGDKLYIRSLIPVEFPQFPFGADVPAKTKITIHGILGSEVAVINSTQDLAIFTQYLKFVKERVVLFDEDRNGLIFDYSNASGSAGTYIAGGTSVIGNYNDKDPREPYIFGNSLEFDSGEELNIYVTVAEPIEGSEISTDYQVIGLIETVERTT